MICRICSNEADFLFKKTVLKKYEVKYFKCPHCFFVQTEEPYWLVESYADAITSLDIGLVYRNFHQAPSVHAIIKTFFNQNERFLDFGGGYGLFVRLMRDRGLNFYRQDKFCENLFAKHFDITDLSDEIPFELVTAFEVFEHLQDPLEGINEMLTHGKSIIFTTELSHESDLSDWWYLLPEIGQHISLYNLRTLQYIAEKNKLNLYTDGVRFHMLTKKKINGFVFKQLTRSKISAIYTGLFPGKQTLLQKDFDFLKRNL